MDRRQQAAAAAERYHEMARDREELKRRQEAEGTRVVDTPERVRARAARLAQAGQLQPEALVKAIAPAEPLEPHVLYVVGEPDDSWSRFLLLLFLLLPPCWSIPRRAPPSRPWLRPGSKSPTATIAGPIMVHLACADATVASP